MTSIFIDIIFLEKFRTNTLNGLGFLNKIPNSGTNLFETIISSSFQIENDEFLTQFCGYALPLLGWVVPLVLWLMKRDESEQIDAHGKIVMNWILSVLIYGIVCGLFSIILIGILIGIPLAIALGIVGVVFPIIGAVKASDGELWPYPMSIRFLK